MLAKCGALQEANAYLISMPHSFLTSYIDYRWYQIALYASYCVQHKEETLHTMQPPNNHLTTLASLIKACGSTCDLEKGKRFHADAEKKGLTSVLFISISLIRMYSKCGCPIDAEFIFMGLSKRDVFSWNAMLSTYLENDRPVNALLGFRQLLEEKLFSPDLVTFTIVLRVCATLGEHGNVVVEGEMNCVVFQEIGRALHSHIRKQNMILDAFLNDAMVNMYGKCGSVREAICVLETSREHSIASWNSVLTTYLCRDEGMRVLLVYREMQKQGVSPDFYSFVSALKACTILIDGEEVNRVKFFISLEIGKALHLDAIHKDLVLNVYVANAIISMYGKCGNTIGAENVFSLLPSHDVVSWNAMLSMYVQHFQVENAFHIFRQMLNEEIHQDMLTFVIVLQACGTLVDNDNITSNCAQGTKAIAYDIGQAIHAHIRKRHRFSSNIYINNTLISMYGKCGNISRAEHVFQSLHKPDVVSWNAMLSAYVEHGKAGKGLQLYREMKKHDENPNKLTYVICLQACGSLADDEDGKFPKLALLDIGQAFHVEIWKKGLLSDVVMDSALVSMYGKCGMILEAETVFNSELIRRNSVTWNAMMSAYIEHGYPGKALELYTKMEVEGMSFDEITLVCVLQACSQVTNLHICKKLHFIIISTGLDITTTLINTLMNTYGCCASRQHALAVFSGISKPDLVSWNACIAGYAYEGSFLGCFQVFETMQFTGVKADCVTMLSLLYACSHDGKVNEGLKYFELITTQCSLYPDLKHYVALLDLFGRIGDFKKIEHTLLMGIPMQANVPFWLCLLGACCTHGNIELANRVFKDAVNLKPSNGSTYILLSNLYATLGSSE